MIDREGLRRFYDGDLAVHLRALEAERLAARRAWVRFAASAVPAVGVAFVISRLNLSPEVGGTIFIAVVVLPFYVFSKLAGEARTRRAQAFRELTGAIAARVLPGSACGPEPPGVSVRDAVAGSGIFSERAEQCDTITAVYGATRPAGLIFAEVRLYRVREWGDLAGRDRQHQIATKRVGSVDVNRRKETDVFRGLFFAFDLGTPIRGTTFVDAKRMGVAIAARDALEPVAFDDEGFESAFRVTSSEPEEAQALLTPSARAGLVRLRETVKRPVHLSFSEGRVSVAIEAGPLFVLESRQVDFERVAEIADLFALADELAAALPLGVPVPTTTRARAGLARGVAAETAPARPATSMTRLTQRDGGLSIVYTRAVSRLALAISLLSAPLMAWFWFLAVREFLDASGDKTGVAAAMIPLSLASVGWLFAAQAWWGPVRRVDVDGAELCVSRGLLRRARVPAASVRSLARKGSLLLADGLAITPELQGAELEWLAYEIGRVLPSATRAPGA